MYKILIIDDDKNLCMLLKKAVITEKIEADCCYTGKDGVDMIANDNYQLIVLDVMMPGMNGFETLEEIRNISNIPILMLTARNDSGSKVKGLRLGADDYLTKPFNMTEFIARVVALIRRYTRFNENEKDIKQLTYEGLTIDLDRHSVITQKDT